MSTEKTVQTFYISTGAKNAMYTLRFWRAHGGFMVDSYVRTLSANAEDAERKGREYYEAFKERVGEHDGYVILFDGEPDHGNTKRRGKLSVRDTLCLENIEAGVFPFGKHRGENIADAPDSYVLFFADKLPTADGDVMQALCAACLGVSLDRGLIAKRDAAKAARRELDIVSQFVGKVGERMVFTGEIVTFFRKTATVYEQGYTLTKIRTAEGNLVDFYNNEMGERGETITFKATVKAHKEFDGVKTTRVNRPKGM